MKKLLAILSMAVSTGVFAASAQLEYQNIDGVNGSSNATQYQLTVREQITTNITGDVAFSNQVKDNTQTLTTRAEAGLTGSYPVAGISLYTRAAVGEKFTGSTTYGNFGYYSVEPGVLVPIGKTGLTARVGYRFRSAFDTANNDTTRTWRAGVSYALTKKDSIGVRYDRVQGDADQTIMNVNYTRNF